MSKRHQLSWKEMREMQNDMLGTTGRYFETHGRAVQFELMGFHLSLICEPELIQQFLVQQGRHLRQIDLTRAVFERITKGLFVSEGEEWKRKRKMMQPMFQAKHIEQYATLMARQANDMCARWHAGETFRVEDEMRGVAMSVIAESMFGANVQADIPEIRRDIEIILQEADSQFKLPVSLWGRTMGKWRQSRAVGRIKTRLLQMVQQRKNEPSLPEEDRDVLGLLLDIEDEAGKRMSEEEIVEECMGIFLGGHETSALALSWALVLLHQHPTVLGRLQLEVNRVLGGEPITHERLSEMPFLGQVIQESLRLYPLVPILGRSPNEQICLDRITFEKDELVFIDLFNLHRQAAFYEDPDQFNPDRFDPAAEPPNRYAFIPFGAGSRTCIGNAFAMLELQIILATILQKIDLELVPGQSFEMVQKVTLQPKDGVQVRIVEKRVEHRQQKRFEISAD